MNAVPALRRMAIVAVAAATPLGAICCRQGESTGVNGPIPASIRVQSLTLDVGEKMPLQFTVLDNAGHEIPGYPVRFQATTPGVAAVTSSGLVSGLSYGSATISLSADAVTQPETVRVAPWPRQPAGFSAVTERDFSRLASTPTDSAGLSGWDPHEEVQFPRLSIVQDPAAPRSPPFALQASYPAGTVGGTSTANPGRVQRWFASPVHAVYLSVWVQLSPNWQAHSTGTNKVLYLYINGQPRFFLSAEGTSSGNLQPSGRLQATPDDMVRHREVLPPNMLPSARVTPGVWQRWELVVRANTPGARDGTFDLWMNGLQVAHYTDVEYLDTAERQEWVMIDIEPIWGGGGDRLADAQWMRFDHIYASVVP